MNGPWHYVEAERLLAGTPRQAEDIDVDGGPRGLVWPASEMELRRALVHAVLANAAAAALNVRRNGAVEAVDEAAGWERVLQ